MALALARTLILQNTAGCISTTGVIINHVTKEILFSLYLATTVDLTVGRVQGHFHSRIAWLLRGRCSNLKRLYSVSRRDVSADLTWRAHRRIAE